MADLADIANEAAERERDYLIARAAGDVPPGPPGECDWCGEWAGRLIVGLCPPCRDALGQARGRIWAQLDRR